MDEVLRLPSGTLSLLYSSRQSFPEIIKDAKFDLEDLESRLEVLFRPKKVIKQGGGTGGAVDDGADAALAEEMDLDAGLSSLSKHKNLAARNYLVSDFMPVFYKLWQFSTGRANHRSEP